jgi:hypothetical protein
MCTNPALKAAPVVCRLIRKNTEKYLAETGWSEKVQDEWLETLWNMMGTFVDLAWGTDSVQAVLKTEKPSSPETLQPKAQRTSNPRNVRKSLKKTGKRRRI